MKPVVGEKVKFLNSKGGGIISAIIDSKTVKVLIEGGFEIPTLISELIPLNPTDAGGHFFDEEFNVSLPVSSAKEEAFDEKSRELSQDAIRKRSEEVIFIAFIPHDQKWLITGPMDVYLVNNTSRDVLYTLFLEKGEKGLTGKDYGSVFAGTRLLIATIDREELVEWTSGMIQFLYFKDDDNTIIPPFNAEFHIPGKQFFSETKYHDSPLVEGKAIVFRLASISEYLVKKSEQEPSAGVSSHAGISSEPELIDRYRTNFREAEVDLHIHQLMEDYSHLDNSEILDYQIKHFLRCMENAISNHYLKVTFIHGVGNGTLREALISELKKYKQIEFFEAPMNKYGMGALEVRIPHNYQK
ncbi:MAG: DUF2027 domain-containing protein [Bacteroidota bacterium]|nr:DUF2027 domain-containing protein [Bacteroidota bacterium]